MEQHLRQLADIALAQCPPHFEQIRVDNVGSGNEGFDISGIFIEQFDAGDPIAMAFNLALRDGDFDISTGMIGVTLTPPDLIL